MFISLDKKFIYYHYPKTGGVSIQVSLKDYGYGTTESPNVNTLFLRKINKEVGNKRIPKHCPVISPLSKELLSKYKNIDFYRFGSVRNPWDLVISMLNFRSIKINKHNIMNFGVLPQFTQVNTMSSFYNFNNDSKDIKIVRLESIEKDFKNVLEDLDINVKLAKKNMLRESKEYEKYYDKESEDYIGNLFKDDIKNFNYKF